MIRSLAIAAIALVAVVASSGRSTAHQIPQQILVRAFVQVEEDRVQLLVRAPLVLFSGMDLPERVPGALDLAAGDAAFDRAAVALADQLRVSVGEQTLRPSAFASRISLPTERVFESFESALAHVLGPDLPADTVVTPTLGFLDAYFRYDGVPAGEPVLDVALATGYGPAVELVLTHRGVGGEERSFRVHGDHGPLALDPGLLAAAATFTRSGIEHILSGWDHLLFLLCLILPFRLADLGALAGIVTAFTVAHSITLIAAATGFAPTGEWFVPAIEAVIALSILFMALENLAAAWVGGDLRRRLRFRWLVTAGFGLIHGFGFASALSSELQFAGDHLIVSLLAFNVGIELGQLGVFLIAIPVLELVFRTALARRAGVAILSALVAHTAWHWTTERGAELAFVSWPEVDPGPVRIGAAALLLVAGLALLLSLRRRERVPSPGDD
jgi:hypothetical protein